MPSVKTGTHTFLFTDIEESTRRWQADREAMSAALTDHDETLKDAIETHGGTVFKHTGDGVCAVFASPRSALGAAAEAQAGLVLPVRMGVHTGEAEHRDGDYFGTALNRCARLMDAGHGGQTLVSETTALLVAGTGLTDLGEHQLKDLTRPERIFQVGDRRFPHLRHQSGATSLPSNLTPLVGRDELVAEVIKQLDEWRLVTLVGVGGVGKTRVAIAAAEQLGPDADLTTFVDLGAATDGADVLPALAAALAVKTPSIDSVTLALTGRRVVVVLDNCEHVLDDAARAVAEMLAASDTLAVVATSREGLAVAGEHLMAVPGLGSDRVDAPAVALFLERARAVDREFSLAGDNETAVVEICRRLDGIPLAIELAAARVGLMTPRELLDRLGERFRMLTGGRRRSVDRHRTLREAIDWSYELLASEEQEAFDRLAVFASTFDVDAATAVLAGPDEFEVLELLGALVDKSLLTTSRESGQSRYRYLETIRSYAQERLDSVEDRDEVEARCNRYLAGRVRSIIDQMFLSPDDLSPQLRAEIPNLRRSLDWALGRDDVDSAAHLITPLLEVAAVIDWHIDGWADEILAMSTDDDHPARAALLALRTIDLWLGGDFGALRGAAQEFMAAAPTTVGGSAPWWISLNYSMLMALGGDDSAATTAFDSALVAAEDESRDVQLYLSVRYLFRLLGESGVVTDLEERFGRDLHAAGAHPSRMIRHLAALAESMRAQHRGDHQMMLEAASRSAELGIEGSGMWFASIDLQSWAHFELGDLSQALAMADHDHDRAFRYGDRSAMVVPILIYALVLLELGEADAAAVIRGWLPRRMTVLLVDRFTEFDRQLGEAVAPDRLDELRAQGRQMDTLALQALAYRHIGPHLASNRAR